ncbi:MAG TPA: vitamin K epoxide reductase family protein, partial [Longimicrobiales bacterium]|nr:vitamin K epoxide reductase family protein [Longimicrobiales bacterium]
MSDIMRRARERDTERVLLYDRTRRATLQTWLIARARSPFPTLLPEYLKVLIGSVLGFWILAWPVSGVFDVSRLYTYTVLGLVFSLQATHTKYRLAKDPDYKVRRCNCGGARKDATETVLQSSASTIVGIPTSLLGVALHGALLAVIYSGLTGTAQILAAVGLLVSVYLAYVMIVKLGALCSTCINIAALNVLI